MGYGLQDLLGSTDSFAMFSSSSLKTLAWLEMSCLGVQAVGKIININVCFSYQNKSSKATVLFLCLGTCNIIIDDVVLGYTFSWKSQPDSFLYCTSTLHIQRGDW